MRYIFRYLPIVIVVSLIGAACDDESKFSIKDNGGGNTPRSTDPADAGERVFYDDLTVCEADDCWCLAIRDCEAVANANVFEGGSQIIQVCGYDGDRCIFRYEDEVAEAVSRYLCNVPIGREECGFELQLECHLVDLCVLGNCPVVDICGSYEG